MTLVRLLLSRFWLMFWHTEGLTDVVGPLVAVGASPPPTTPPFTRLVSILGKNLRTLLPQINCTWSTGACLQIALHTPQLSSLRLSPDNGQGTPSQLCSALTDLTLSSFALVHLDLLCLPSLATLHLDTPKLTQVS